MVWPASGGLCTPATMVNMLVIRACRNRNEKAGWDYYPALAEHYRKAFEPT
jgi:hypothetical protein